MRVLLAVLILLTAVSVNGDRRALLMNQGAAAGGGGGGSVAFVGAATSTAIASASSITLSITIPAGSDRGLFVGVGAQHASASVSGVTFDGVAMTELWDYLSTAGDGFTRTAGYILAAPNTGTHDVVVTFTGNVDLGVCGAIWVTGCNQSTPNRTAVTASGNNSSLTVTASDAVSGDLVVDSACNFASTIGPAGADQTSQCEDDAIAGSGQSYGSSTQDGANGGVMSWTTSSTFWAIGAVAIRP